MKKRNLTKLNMKKLYKVTISKRNKNSILNQNYEQNNMKMDSYLMVLIGKKNVKSEKIKNAKSITH